MKNQQQFIYFLIAMVIAIVNASCNKNEIGPQGISSNNTLETIDLFIVNEGVFGLGNASLSIIDLDAQLINNNYFFNANNEPLGDVFQSMEKINDKYYFVVNNSQKIIVTDSSLNQLTTITDLDSPRYITQVTPDKAYITDLYADQISTLDINTNQVSGFIPVAGWTEKIVVVGNYVFVQEKENAKLLVINSETDQIESEMQLAEGISDMFVANDSSIWVLCDGGFVEPILPKLFQIDSQSFSIIQMFNFNPNDSSPQHLSYNAADEVLYFYQGGGIKQMELSADSLPTMAFIEDEIAQVYGVDYDNTNDILVVSDARDYVSQGQVLFYSTSGTLLNSFDVGINPNGIFVKN